MGQWRQNPIPRAPNLPPVATQPAPGTGAGHWVGGGQWRPRRWVPDAAPAPTPAPPTVQPPVSTEPTPAGPPVPPLPTTPDPSMPINQPLPQPGLDPGLPSSGANGGFNYGDYNDPYNAYLASIPVMQDQMNHQIGQAMAQAGFTGNRWSTSAENQAGQIGAETALKMNQMLNQTMSDQANQDLNRAYGTAQQYQALGGAQNSAMNDQLAQLMGYGTWEQGRQDNFAKANFDQFNQDRLGILPLLIQAASSQGNPTGGVPYQIQTSPGTNPTIPPQLVTALLSAFGG